jgi:hypothetical protein
MKDARFEGKPMQVRTAAYVEPVASKIDLEDMAERSQPLLDPGRFAPRNEEELERLARRYYFSMKLPDSYYPKKYDDRWTDWAIEQGIAKAYIAMLEGDAIGIGPVMAIKHIHIINGISTLSADLMFGRMLATRVLRRDDFTLKADKMQCEIVIGVKTRPVAERLVVLAKYEDFKHLHGKDNWRNDPEGMLVARAKSRACKRHAPDLFVGLYSREEIQDLADDRRAGLAIEVPNEFMPTGEHSREPIFTEPTQDTPASPTKPARTKADFDALMARVKGASDAITPDDIVVLRAEIDLWADDPKNHAHFVRAWQQNGALNPAQVAP